jgi:hypothetical protein
VIQILNRKTFGDRVVPLNVIILLFVIEKNTIFSTNLLSSRFGLIKLKVNSNNYGYILGKLHRPQTKEWKSVSGV